MPSSRTSATRASPVRGSCIGQGDGGGIALMASAKLGWQIHVDYMIVSKQQGTRVPVFLYVVNILLCVLLKLKCCCFLWVLRVVS